MNHKILVGLLAFIFITSVVSAQRAAAVPKDATILESQAVGHNRRMILWIRNLQKHPSEYSSDDPYTCPDQTRGSYYSGELNITLLNSLTRKAINSLKILGYEDQEPATIDIPYLIRSGFYYYVPDGSKRIERRPRIMNLKDHNGDGSKAEFALFDAVNCTVTGSTLIGYSERRDRVIQYSINVKSPEGNETRYWLPNLFSKKPIRPGHWRYQIDTRQFDGTLDTIDIRYDRKTQIFRGIISRQK